MRKNIIIILGFLAVTFITSSCLKDDLGENWTADLKGKRYAEFSKPNFQATTISPTADDQFLTLMVNIATDEKPSDNNTITVAIDQAAMDAYTAKLQAADTSMHWAFELFPGATIETPQISIPAGSRNATFRVKLPRADTLRISAKYMIPITITDASNGIVIASNMKTALVSVPIANQWEGDYASTGRIHKETAWDRTWESTKHLYTIDATTVEYDLADIGLICDIKIDPLTNKVLSIYNIDQTYDVQLNTPQTNFDDQGGDSRWDPDSQTFYLFYYYVGSGDLKRVAHEVLVKQ